MGESGSGKSVTLRAITRLLRRATVTGQVLWRGQDLLRLPEPAHARMCAGGRWR